jgi:hypothetical protein
MQSQEVICPENWVSHLSPSIFWDTDRTTLSEKKHIAYITERVLTHGLWQDFLLLKKHCSKRKIKRVVKNIRYLDDKVLNFCSVYFQIPLEQFRSFTLKQSNLIHWNY